MIDFIEYYTNKNYNFGECLSEKNSDFMYVYIPKNATSWTKDNLINLGWEFYNYHTDNLYYKHSIIILRDPIDRWLSGIAEYFYLRHRNFNEDNFNKFLLDIVFERIAFDDHTEKQVLFLQNLDLTKCTFFWCDVNYRNQISSFLKEQGIPNTFYKNKFVHVTKNSILRSKFHKIFKQALENNSKYKQQLQWYFAKDYKLIESVQFYAR